MRNEILIRAWTSEERDMRVLDSVDRGYDLVQKGQEYNQSAHRTIYWAKVRREILAERQTVDNQR